MWQAIALAWMALMAVAYDRMGDESGGGGGGGGGAW